MKMTDEDVKYVYFIINKYYKQYLYDEDMVQTAMEGACKAYSKVEEDHPAKSSYIARAILNSIAKEYRLREKCNRPTVSLDAPLNITGKPISLHEMIPGSPLYSESFTLPDWMTDDEKTLVYMLDEGYSYTEIGEYFGITREGVRYRQHQLQSKLIRKGYLVGKEHRYGRCKRGCKTLSDEGITSGKSKVSRVSQSS